MAKLLWGRVYYQDNFAGFLREEPGGRSSFTYDESYLDSASPAIAHTLPLRSNPFIQQSGLPTFFDNLVAEGWLEEAQTRLLGKRAASRFELLLAFGQDCAGAVSVKDPEPVPLSQDYLHTDDPKEMAALASRASLSGVQPKLMLVTRAGKLYPAKMLEVSTHIAKFPSLHHKDLVFNEYLCTLAHKALLPEDSVVDLWLGELPGFSEPALMIKRFDRDKDGSRLHFEEYNQLLDLPSHAKYEGAYRDLADFIYITNGCLPAEVYRLFLRILAGFLLGNTDMHLKNFAMFHTATGLRLTPAYDVVAAALYNYKTVALKIGGARDLLLGKLKPGNIIKLGAEFKLSKTAIQMACDHLAKNLAAAKQAIAEAPGVSTDLKSQLTTLMEKRWNGTFALIGQSL